MKDLQIMPINEVTTMATNLCASGLFPGIKNEKQAFTLMMLCQSEGLHPMKALQRYDIIEGRPGLKAAAMQADFQKLGGEITILKRDSECAQMMFKYRGMETTITVTFEEFVKSGVAKGKYGIKANWQRHPRQMLHARCVSEGINAVCPQVKVGMVTPEELMDLSEMPENADDIMLSEEPEYSVGEAKISLPEEEIQISKDSRKLRAALNKELQPLNSVGDIRTVCQKYNKTHGTDFWETFTYHKNEKVETYKDLYISHLNRVNAKNERHTPEMHADWIKRLTECDAEKYWSFYDGYNQDEMYQTDNACFEALANRAKELGYWDDESDDGFLTKKQIEETK